MRYATFIIFLALCSPALAAPPITDDNWRTHPQIVEIRQIYNDIIELEQNGELRLSEKECTRWHGNFQQNFSLLQDKDGQVRKYMVDAGSGDSAADIEYYYQDGRIRFSFQKRGNTFGSSEEIRSYFDASGKLLYQHRTGEGGIGAELDEEVQDPAGDYRSQYCDNACSDFHERQVLDLSSQEQRDRTALDTAVSHGCETKRRPGIIKKADDLFRYQFYCQSGTMVVDCDFSAKAALIDGKVKYLDNDNCSLFDVCVVKGAN